MVDPTGRVWLIDLENARRHRDKKSLRISQTEDLRRLFHVRSWQANPAAADIFRQRLRETPAIQTAIAEPGGETHLLAPGAEFACVEPQRLTVLIPCRAAVVQLSNCVDAVRDFADEILLAIPEANDAAWTAAENLADCRTFWCGRFDEKSFRRAVAAAQHSWVLVVEPDERVSPDLAKEIQFLLAENPTKRAYQVKRRSSLGRAMRFGFFAADSTIRLVGRDGGVGSTLDGNLRHLPQEVIGTLRCPIFHDRAA